MTGHEDFWENRYQSAEQVWSGRVNRFLAEVVTELATAPDHPLAPGEALDLGCAEGADSVWLASQGWQVLGVDVSQTALDRTNALAAREGVADRVTTQRHDLSLTFPDGRFDLVSAQFFQSPVEGFDRWTALARAASAITPGGVLLLVDHGTVPPWVAARHAAEGHHHVFPTLEENLHHLEQIAPSWTRRIAELRSRDVAGPDGEQATVEDLVIAVQAPGSTGAEEQG